MRTVLFNRRILAFTLALTSGLCVPAAARQRPTDEEVAYQVREAVRRDARVDSSRVWVASREGIVTLSGVVNTLAARNYADLEAKKIDGVLGILNEIEVDPVWRSDADLRQTVRRKILGSAVIRSQQIGVTAAQGSIALEGTVPSEVERSEAELLATRVRGVKAVRNHLTVQPTKQRTDSEIEADAKTALGLDVYLAPLPIAVFVENGIVHLTGTVGSAYEQDRAGRKVRWLPGVREVENDLVARWWEDAGERKEEPRYSDNQIRETATEIMRLDPRVEAEDVSVRVAAGHVRLTGSVPLALQRGIAEQDVRDVVGVVGVTNAIVGRPQNREDWPVADDIRYNLMTDPATEGLDISVDVRRGVATLGGRVQSWAQWQLAEDIAQRVQGVRRVVNRLGVDPQVDADDEHLASEVRFGVRWNWSTSGASDRIHVAVEDGVVRLTGEVDRWSQRTEATRIAAGIEGIRRVDNELTVKGYERRRP